MNDGGAIHLNPEKNTSLLCISSCFLGFYPLKHEKQDLEYNPPRYQRHAHLGAPDSRAGP